MTPHPTQRTLSCRLICWAIALLGLVIINSTMPDSASGQQPVPSAITMPTPTQSIAGPALQANELYTPDAAIVVFLFLGAFAGLLYSRRAPRATALRAVSCARV